MDAIVRVLKPQGTLAIIDFQPIPRVKFMLYQIVVTISQRKVCEDCHPGFSREEIARLLSPYHLVEMDYQELDAMGRLGWLKIPLFLARAKRKRGEL